MHYEVTTEKGSWRGSYDARLNLKDQPSAYHQALINAKSHGGKVFEVDGDKREQVYPK